MRILEKILLMVMLLLIAGLVKIALAEKIEKDIPLSEVPGKIMRAAKKEIIGIKITEAEMIEKEDGEIVYELEGEKESKTYEIQINAKGNILRSELEEEFEDEKREKDLSKLPDKVHETARNAKEGIALTGFSTEREGGRLIYEVEGNVDSKCYEIEITSEGKVVEIEKCD